MGLFSELFGASAFGSSSGSHSSGKATSDTAASSTTINTAFDAASKEQLDALLSSLLDKQHSIGQGYDKASAIADTQGQIDQIFQKYKTDTLPQIVSMQGANGVYNATGVQALADHAYGQAVSQGAALTHQAITDYANILQSQEQLNLSGILQALGLEKDAYSTQKTNAQSSTTTKSSSNTIGASLGVKAG